MKRREAINKLGIGTAGIFVLPAAFIACEKEETTPDNNNTNNNGGDDLTIDLSESQNSALLTPGGFLISGNIIIINDGGNYVALSKVCTHSGCEITYSAANNNLPCPCHGSVFSLAGSVLNGPATSSLKTYNVSKSGDILTIS